MTHEEWQEGFSQIRKLIYRTQGQLYGVQRRRYPIWQIANCVCTAREQLQKAEQELNELDPTAEIGDVAEERLQSMVMWKKERQRAREIGDAAKELWRMDAQRTAKVLRTVSASSVKGGISSRATCFMISEAIACFSISGSWLNASNIFCDVACIRDLRVART